MGLECSLISLLSGLPSLQSHVSICLDIYGLYNDFCFLIIAVVFVSCCTCISQNQSPATSWLRLEFLFPFHG